MEIHNPEHRIGCGCERSLVYQHFSLVMYDGQTNDLYKIVDYTNSFYDIGRSEEFQNGLYRDTYNQVKNIELRIVPYKKESIQSFDANDSVKIFRYTSEIDYSNNTKYIAVKDMFNNKLFSVNKFPIHVVDDWFYPNYENSSYCIGKVEYNKREHELAKQKELERQMKETEAKRKEEERLEQARIWEAGRAEREEKERQYLQEQKELEENRRQELVEKRREYMKIHRFLTDFHNREYCDESCKGWDGFARRCECGNRRIDWVDDDLNYDDFDYCFHYEAY